MGLIGFAMGGAGDAGQKIVEKGADYLERSTLQQEAAAITAQRDKALAELAQETHRVNTKTDIAAIPEKGAAETGVLTGREEALRPGKLKTAQGEAAIKLDTALKEIKAKFEGEKEIHAADRASAERVATIHVSAIRDSVKNAGLSLGMDNDGNMAVVDLKTQKVTPLLGADGKTIKASKNSDPVKLLEALGHGAKAAAEAGDMDLAKRLTGSLEALSQSLLGKAGVERPAVPIPSAAVDALKKNPALAGDFDAKYGKGAAARTLGTGAPESATENAPNSELISEPPGTPQPAGPGLIQRARDRAKAAADAEAARRQMLKEKGEGYGDAQY